MHKPGELWRVQGVWATPPIRRQLSPASPHSCYAHGSRAIHISAGLIIIIILSRLREKQESDRTQGGSAVTQKPKSASDGKNSRISKTESNGPVSPLFDGSADLPPSQAGESCQGLPQSNRIPYLSLWQVICRTCSGAQGSNWALPPFPSCHASRRAGLPVVSSYPDIVLFLVYSPLFYLTREERTHDDRQ